MYKIKQTPEDFIVKEINNIKTKNSGRFAICLLKKTNYTTQRAIDTISKYLGKDRKAFSFAGTKDKLAVTEQYISIKNAKKDQIESISLKDIELKFLGYSDSPLSLGMLEGNEFIIKVNGIENLDEKALLEKKHMPNYFGEQRFSKNNAEIGKLLLKSLYKEAIDLILKSNSDYSGEITGFLKKNQNSFIPALKLIPKRLLQLYLHAYQSRLWNIALEEYLKNSKEDIMIPLVGFGTEIENLLLKEIIGNIIKTEGISFREFINRKLPSLSLEGGKRPAFVEIQDLRILEKTKDSITLNFKLRKGSYATVAVKFLIQSF